ncbi:hypothetical protein K469DRAFT_234751 [Zopfia rhizophila CBS 207.26]|uniref:Fungal N-terminal domain-containing protein n=1 Tax=Zopfia rhizophila CBS 207.26 TaxID=1314779 RepID=A0A6A6ETF3_9PEZI|nr:hypothetical protein K469DRAFT_234751 [Zopfia rhizophila CBS 207.26]
MAELFGVAAAAITLVPVFIKFSRSLRRCVKTIIYAKKEILDLSQEAFVFASILAEFAELAEKDHGSARTVRDLEKLIKWSRYALKGLRVLLRKVRCLSFNSGASTIAIILAHKDWLLNRRFVKSFRASLCAAREYMALSLHLRIIKKLDEELGLLNKILARGDSLTREQKIMFQRLKQKSRARKKMAHESHSSLERAREKVLHYETKLSQDEDFVPDPKPLFKLANSVGKDTARILRTTKPKSEENSHASRHNDPDRISISSRNSASPRSRVTRQHSHTPNMSNRSPIANSRMNSSPLNLLPRRNLASSSNKTSVHVSPEAISRTGNDHIIINHGLPHGRQSSFSESSSEGTFRTRRSLPLLRHNWDTSPSLTQASVAAGDENT